MPEVDKVVMVTPNAFDIECIRCADCRPALAQLAVEKGWGLLELRAIDASLEDIFLELTANHEVSH